MLHKIQLTGLKVWGYHGVYDHERAYGQEFVIDAAVWVDGSRAALTDNIGHTVNYGTLARILAEDAKKDPVDLLETLAERLLGKVMEIGGGSISKASVTVHKPNAPIDYEFTDVSVTVEAERG
jgi:7,8-dihydroneopterin aldolase/epimerase/oxygenase